MAFIKAFTNTKRPPQIIVTAEAVKAKASKEVQDQYTKADTLRQEASELELRIKGLNLEIEKAFSAKDVEISNKEYETQQLYRQAEEKLSAISISENRLAEKRKKSDEEIANFNKKMAEKEEALIQVNEQLKIDRKDVDLKREELKIRHKNYSVKLGELEIIKSQLKSDREAFEDEKEAWNNKVRDLSGQENKIRNDLVVLETSRKLLNDNKKDLEAKKVEFSILKKESEELILEAESKRKNNEEKAALIKLLDEQIVSANKNLVDEENRLNVFKQTLDLKQRELQIRESNLKQLEAGKK